MLARVSARNLIIVYKNFPVKQLDCFLLIGEWGSELVCLVGAGLL